MLALPFQIIAGILGLWLAIKFVPGVEFIGTTKVLYLMGFVLGLINFFLKPLLKKISFIFIVLTFGLFSLILNMLLVWTIDILFHELAINGLKALFLTTIIVSGLSWILSFPPKTKN